MGLNINAVALMARLSGRHGRILTLGRQRILFDSARLERVLGVRFYGEVLDDVAVLGALGYCEVESIDVSDYEGATRIVDLNEPIDGAEMFGSYEAVLTGGTLEHVFDVAQAVRTTASCVKVGGRLIHIGPVNGWIDHGFYQLCPTWMLDYLGANEWNVVKSVLIDRMSDREGRNVWRVRPSHHRGRVEGVKQLHFCVAERQDSSTVDQKPTQSLYRRKFGQASNDGAWEEFPAYDLIDGVEVQTDRLARYSKRGWTRGLRDWWGRRHGPKT